MKSSRAPRAMRRGGAVSSGLAGSKRRWASAICWSIFSSSGRNLSETSDLDEVVEGAKGDAQGRRGEFGLGGIEEALGFGDLLVDLFEQRPEFVGDFRSG